MKSGANCIKQTCLQGVISNYIRSFAQMKIIM